MNQDLENEVKSIDKFISKLFKPAFIHIEKKETPLRYTIIFYFDHIDDKYIRNPNSNDIKSHKSEILTREIRKYVYDFLGIQTSGFQPPDFFAPSEFHPISIFVVDTNVGY